MLFETTLLLLAPKSVVPILVGCSELMPEVIAFVLISDSPAMVAVGTFVEVGRVLDTTVSVLKLTMSLIVLALSKMLVLMSGGYTFELDSDSIELISGITVEVVDLVSVLDCTVLLDSVVLLDIVKLPAIIVLLVGIFVVGAGTLMVVSAMLMVMVLTSVVVVSAADPVVDDVGLIPLLAIVVLANAGSVVVVCADAVVSLKFGVVLLGFKVTVLLVMKIPELVVEPKEVVAVGVLSCTILVLQAVDAVVVGAFNSVVLMANSYAGTVLVPVLDTTALAAVASFVDEEKLLPGAGLVLVKAPSVFVSLPIEEFVMVVLVSVVIVPGALTYVLLVMLTALLFEVEIGSAVFAAAIVVVLTE